MLLLLLQANTKGQNYLSRHYTITFLGVWCTTFISIYGRIIGNTNIAYIIGYVKQLGCYYCVFYSLQYCWKC